MVVVMLVVVLWYRSARPRLPVSLIQVSGGRRRTNESHIDLGGGNPKHE